MGKDKSKKKQGIGIEKQLKKQSAKQSKELKNKYNEDDIDSIVEQLNKQQKINDLKHNTINTIICDNPPSPRSSATITYIPSKNELILFGGEYYNNTITICYNDLYVYNIAKQQWKLIQSSNSPTPRSSHTSTLVNDLLYVFGGEFTSRSGEQFYHFNDLYALNINTYQWQKIIPNDKITITARSGHRTIYDKHNQRLITFGGFHDNGKIVKYYNDLHIYDIQNNIWQQHKYDNNNTTSLPSTRSGFVFQINDTTNIAYIYGGTSIQPKTNDIKKQKLLLSQGYDVNKPVYLNDLWALDLNTMKFTNIRKQGLYPNLRSGISSTVIQSKQYIVLFGGVAVEQSSNKNHNNNDETDSDSDEYTQSYNDLYIYDMNDKKFFSVNIDGIESHTDTLAIKALQQKKQKHDKEQQKLQQQQNNNSIDTSTQQQSVFDFNPVIVDLPQNSNNNTQLLNNNTTTTQSNNNNIIPPGRRSSMLASNGTILYIYGGVKEESDIDIILNDLYSIDISSKHEYKCLIECDIEAIAKQLKQDNSDISDDDDSSDTSVNESDTETDDDNTEHKLTLADYFQQHKKRLIEQAEKLLTDSDSLNQQDVEISDKQQRKLIKQRAFEVATEEYNDR